MPAPAEAASAPSRPTPPTSRRSYRESWRAWISVGVATVIGLLVQIALVATDVINGQREIQMVGVALIYSVFCLVHTSWTHLLYRGLSGDDLQAAVAVQRRRDRVERASWWGRMWNSTSHAPSWAAQVAVIALAGVLIVIIVPGLRTNPVFLGAAMVLVVTSWLNTVVNYAVHYARLDSAERHVAFPGEQERSFTDYLYLAMAVQTTFGTTDAEVVTTDMRRTVMTHGVIAFVFNSVIIAMIISLLIGS